MLYGFWMFVIVVHAVLLILSQRKAGKQPWMSTVSHSVMLVYTIYFLSLFRHDSLFIFVSLLPFSAPFFLPILIWWFYLISLLFKSRKKTT